MIKHYVYLAKLQVLDVCKSQENAINIKMTEINFRNVAKVGYQLSS